MRAGAGPPGAGLVGRRGALQTICIGPALRAKPGLAALRRDHQAEGALSGSGGAGGPEAVAAVPHRHPTPGRSHPAASWAPLYAQRKNLLDVYHVEGVYVGVLREEFERVVGMEGCELSLDPGDAEVWQFRHAGASLHGRLLNVAAFLHPGRVALNTRGRAYTVTRQDFTLALMFPGAPRRLHLDRVRHRVVQLDGRRPYPEQWPRELVRQVIRTRFRTIVILNESFLLQQIGLRPSR